MKTENTMPLYKALNEKRTRGIFNPQKYNANMLVNSDDLVTYDCLCTFPIPKDEKYQSDEQKSNVLYTALAVNNLLPVADALLLIKEVLESWNGEGKYTNLINHANSALSKIS